MRSCASGWVGMFAVDEADVDDDEAVDVEGAIDGVCLDGAPPLFIVSKSQGSAVSEATRRGSFLFI